jgi:hypothetical protein
MDRSTLDIVVEKQIFPKLFSGLWIYDQLGHI